MSINQPRRLSYTRRDLLSLHNDVDRYIKEYIPRIQDTSQANTGRLFLTVCEALVDNLNFSVDQAHLESLLTTARQRKNIIMIANMLGYAPSSVSPGSVDLTFSMLSGVAGPGGQAIPVFTRCQTTTAPIVEFITTEVATIPEGETQVTVPAIQGIRIVGEVLTSSSDGSPNQVYTLSNSRTPHNLIEVSVDGVIVDQEDYFADGNEDEIIYTLAFDDDDYTSVYFGDDEFGKAPPTGSEIKVTYVQSVGADGNAPVASVTRVVGSLASIVGVTNAEAASGGASSESNASIKRNAPASRRSADRIVGLGDHETIANNVAGVYSSFAKPVEGARTDTYIMPEGGGVASTYLLNLVQEEFDEKKIEGAVPKALPLAPADVLITVNVVTFTSKIAKSTVKQKVRTETTDALDYTRILPGRGFTLSDLSGIYEAIDNGDLIDYVDFITLSRVPRITKSNASAPDFFGRVDITNLVGYDTYLVTAVSTTGFLVSINGTPQSVAGTVAVEYTTDNGEVTFTLGEVGDTFTVGDTWTFTTSKYRDNLVIDEDEFMRLLEPTDLIVSVFYPGEYNLKTQSAV